MSVHPSGKPWSRSHSSGVKRRIKFLRSTIITSRNLQPWFYQAFRPLIKKITHFFAENTWLIPKNLRRSRLIIFYFNRLEAIFCYHVILAAIPPIRILSYPNSSNFILIPLYFPNAPGNISCSSGIWIFLLPIPLCRIVTLFWVPNPGSHPVCCAPTCLP